MRMRVEIMMHIKELEKLLNEACLAVIEDGYIIGSSSDSRYCCPFGALTIVKSPARGVNYPAPNNEIIYPTIMARCEDINCFMYGFDFSDINGGLTTSDYYKLGQKFKVSLIVIEAMKQIFGAA